jgi:hypothetical protein
MINPDFWYDHENPSKLLAALWEVRRLCTSAEQTHRITRKPGSYVRVEAIKKAIDDYAECEFGNREYFWNRPHKAG